MCKPDLSAHERKWHELERSACSESSAHVTDVADDVSANSHVLGSKLVASKLLINAKSCVQVYEYWLNQKYRLTVVYSVGVCPAFVMQKKVHYAKMVSYGGQCC